MKYGHKLLERQSALEDVFPSSCWTDYKKLKKLLKDEKISEEQYFDYWEEQLIKVADTVREYSVGMSDCEKDEALQEYILANKEALRKSVKKWDKNKNNQHITQQSMRKRMTDFVLRSVTFREENEKLLSRNGSGQSLYESAQQVYGREIDSDSKSVEDVDEEEEDVATVLKPKNIFRLRDIPVAILFCVVVASEPLAVEWSKEDHDEIQYLPGSVIFMEAVFSTFIACVLCFCVNPSKKESVSVSQSTASLDVFKTRMEDLRECVLLENVRTWVPVAATKCFGDTMAIVAINYVSPSTYMVLSQSRLILSGVLAHFFLESKPNQMQWHAMLIVASGILTFKFAHDGNEGTSFTSRNLIATIVLIFAVLFKVSASILMEKIMKDKPQSMFSQCSNLGLATMPPALFIGLSEAYWIGSRNKSSPFDVLIMGWTEVIVGLTLFLVIKNWYAILIIKQHSAVVKYVMYATAVVLTYALEVAFFKASFELVSLLGTIVIMQGVIMFADAKQFMHNMLFFKNLATTLQEDKVEEERKMQEGKTISFNMRRSTFNKRGTLHF